MGEYLAQGVLSPYPMNENQVFFSLAQPNSVNKHFII